MQPILSGDGELEQRESNLIDGVEADKKNYIFAHYLQRYWCSKRGKGGRLARIKVFQHTNVLMNIPPHMHKFII